MILKLLHVRSISFILQASSSDNRRLNFYE